MSNVCFYYTKYKELYAALREDIHTDKEELVAELFNEKTVAQLGEYSECFACLAAAEAKNALVKAAEKEGYGTVILDYCQLCPILWPSDTYCTDEGSLFDMANAVQQCVNTTNLPKQIYEGAREVYKQYTTWMIDPPVNAAYWEKDDRKWQFKLDDALNVYENSVFKFGYMPCLPGEDE